LVRTLVPLCCAGAVQLDTSPALAQSEPFRMMTLNTALIPFAAPDAAGCDNDWESTRYWTCRVAALAPRILDGRYDVVVLEEVFDYLPRDLLLKLFAGPASQGRFPYVAYHFEDSAGPWYNSLTPSKGGGLMIIARPYGRNQRGRDSGPRCPWSFVLGPSSPDRSRAGSPKTYDRTVTCRKFVALCDDFRK
jgi:hypothetical protein